MYYLSFRFCVRGWFVAIDNWEAAAILGTELVHEIHYHVSVACVSGPAPRLGATGSDNGVALYDFEC